VRPAPRAAAALLALVAVAGPPRAAADAAADAAALATVEHALAALSAVSAPFTQELVDHDGKVVDHAEGVLYLRRPGHFRWDYSKPAQLIVSDGETLTLYDPELQQATVRRVKDTLSQTPAMLLSGTTRVADSFAVSAAGSDAGLAWVRLVPLRNDTDFRELRLGFAGPVLKRLELADKLNQVTRIELERIDPAPHLPDTLFRFVAPAGVDVIGPKP
jgi:outer membrane lipoprotein carrier protein